MRGRGETIATAIFIVTLCSVTALLAMPLLYFGLAEATPSETQSRALLEPLTQSRVVGALARRDLLGISNLQSDATPRMAEIETLLSEMPLDSSNWLQLAIARRDAGLPLERVASAFTLSRLTGRLEGELLTARLRFALPIWAELTLHSRKQVIADLLNGGWGLMTPDEQIELRAILSRGSEEMRDDLRVRLMKGGAAGKNIIQSAGLNSVRPAKGPSSSVSK